MRVIVGSCVSWFSSRNACHTGQTVNWVNTNWPCVIDLPFASLSTHYVSALFSLILKGLETFKSCKFTYRVCVLWKPCVWILFGLQLTVSHSFLVAAALIGFDWCACTAVPWRKVRLQNLKEFSVLEHQKIWGSNILNARESGRKRVPIIWSFCKNKTNCLRPELERPTLELHQSDNLHRMTPSQDSTHQRECILISLPRPKTAQVVTRKSSTCQLPCHRLPGQPSCKSEYERIKIMITQLMAS